MDIHSWWLFLAGAFFICASPGPNMLQVMSSGVRYGFRPTLCTMAGCFLAVSAMIVASLLGVGAFMEAFPELFDALCYAGALYLIYLGVSAWRNSGKVQASVADNASEAVNRADLFKQGLKVGLSNPKALLFATAFFPQFLDSARSQWVQFAILLATFSVVEIGWYMAYASGGVKLTRALQKAHVKRLFDRLTGSLFIAFGAAMARPWRGRVKS